MKGKKVKQKNLKKWVKERFKENDIRKNKQT